MDLTSVIVENVNSFIHYDVEPCVEVRVKYERPGWRGSQSFRNHCTLYVPLNKIPFLVSIPGYIVGDQPTEVGRKPSTLTVYPSSQIVRLDKHLFGDDGESIPLEYITFANKRPIPSCCGWWFLTDRRTSRTTLPPKKMTISVSWRLLTLIHLLIYSQEPRTKYRYNREKSTKWCAQCRVAGRKGARIISHCACIGVMHQAVRTCSIRTSSSRTSVTVCSVLNICACTLDAQP